MRARPLTRPIPCADMDFLHTAWLVRTEASLTRRVVELERAAAPQGSPAIRAAYARKLAAAHRFLAEVRAALENRQASDDFCGQSARAHVL